MTSLIIKSGISNSSLVRSCFSFNIIIAKLLDIINYDLGVELGWDNLVYNHNICEEDLFY